jgi:hypothetical protein
MGQPKPVSNYIGLWQRRIGRLRLILNRLRFYKVGRFGMGVGHIHKARVKPLKGWQATFAPLFCTRIKIPRPSRAKYSLYRKILAMTSDVRFETWRTSAFCNESVVVLSHTSENRKEKEERGSDLIGTSAEVERPPRGGLSVAQR